jgi:hypothetical protein
MATRPLYPSIFVRIGISIVLALAAIGFLSLFPAIADRWRVSLAVVIALAISSLLFFVMNRRRAG